MSFCSLQPITEDEVRKAIKKLKNGKSTGIDQIQPELLNSSTTLLMVTKLCKDIWTTKTVPSDWKQGIIIPLPEKGDLTDCNNIGQGSHYRYYQFLAKYSQACYLEELKKP